MVPVALPSVLLRMLLSVLVPIHVLMSGFPTPPDPSASCPSGWQSVTAFVPRNVPADIPEVTEPPDEPASDDNGTIRGLSPQEWMDRLIYIQWGSRPEVCWPIQIVTPQSVECGSVAIMMAAIILSGDYTLTPNSILAATEARYGGIAPNQGYNKFLNYIEEAYGVHHRDLGHITSEQAKEILSQKGHLIQVGEGCDGRFGLPFCKAEGVPARCCHGHTILFYRYEDGVFYAKDSAPGDGAAMCLYPEGPLTVRHQGASGGRCTQNGKTVSYDNYANEFLVNGWCVELWSDNPADGPVVMPDSFPGDGTESEE